MAPFSACLPFMIELFQTKKFVIIIMNGKNWRRHTLVTTKLNSHEQDRGNYSKDAKEAFILLKSEQGSYHGLLSNSRKPLALYLFDEQSGTTIQDRSGSKNDLCLPKIFNPLPSTVMRLSKRKPLFSRSNLMDIIVNILGFIPFGFFLVWLRHGETSPYQ